MKKYIILKSLFRVSIFLFHFGLNAQFQNLIVEKYYISGAKDTSDFIDTKLPEGSVTYRVFAQLDDGFVLKKVYADSIYPLIISSSEPFFNHLLGRKSYGYLLPGERLSFSNSTLGLDSWFTIGYASDKHIGLLKTEDTDTSVYPDGTLINIHDDYGIPVSEKDGLILADSSINYWEISENILLNKTPFNADSTGKLIKLNDFVISSGIGFRSPKTGNKILIAQITTHGNLQMKFNLEILDPSNNNYKYHYVSKDTLTGKRDQGIAGKRRTVVFSNQLTYPAKTGCTDPYFACYDPDAVIDDGSCSQCDSMKLGCLDPLACNYDPEANFHIKEICCYGPDNCDNRDISIVCPGYIHEGIGDVSIYPVPAFNTISLNINASSNIKKSECIIINAFGKSVMTFEIPEFENQLSKSINISSLENGIYIIKLLNGKDVIFKKFIKSN